MAAAMLWRLDSPLVDMLNVRYLIGSSPRAPKWVERFRPPLGQPPPARYEPYWDPLLAVFENTQVMPRAFVAYQARLASTQDEEAQLVARPILIPIARSSSASVGKRCQDAAGAQHRKPKPSPQRRADCFAKSVTK